jgi:hypothetical protein
MLVKQKQGAALVCGVLLIVLAALRPLLMPSTADLSARFDTKSKIVMADVLAARVVLRHPGRSIAIVTLPEVDESAWLPTDQKEAESLIVKAFRDQDVDPLLVPLPIDPATRQALAASRNMTIDGPDDSPDMAYYGALMSILTGYGVEEINRTLRDLKSQADVVVWTVPVARPVSSRLLLPAGQGPELVLVKSSVDDLADALQHSVLDMYLTYLENASWELDYDWPSSTDQAFNERYVLVTREDPGP